MELRSFLAFELSPEMKSAVKTAYEDASKSRLDVRWVRPEGIHVTVVFMGNIKEEEIAPMGSEIGKVCSDFAPFRASLKGIGCFPNHRNPRVIWIGMEGDIERLSRFRDDLQKRLIPFGIEVETRALKPHLTLGRFKKPLRDERELRKFMEQHSTLTSASCSLHELVLFKSALNPGGAIYTKLLSWPLSGKR